MSNLRNRKYPCGCVIATDGPDSLLPSACPMCPIHSKDTERLDWMISRGASVDIGGTPKYQVWGWVKKHWHPDGGASLELIGDSNESARAAIDDAIRKEEVMPGELKSSKS